MEKTERETWVDVARGILIIFVVIGHSYNDCNKYSLINFIYFFHMPAFFMLSGYLYKPNIPIKEFIIKKSKRLMIPYFSYLALTIFLFRIFVSPYKNIQNFMKDIALNLYGGNYTTAQSGVLWFLSCLFLIEIFWHYINTRIKSDIIKYGIVVIIYLLIHLPTQTIISMPFGYEHCVIALFYYAVGTKIKQFCMSKRTFAITGLLTALIFFAYYNKYLNYRLDICLHIYNHVFLDAIIPVTISLILFSTCYYLKFSNIKVLKYLGISTLPIMCLHKVLNAIFYHYVHYGAVLYILIGLTLPLAFALLFKKNKVLSMLFLGKSISAKKNIHTDAHVASRVLSQR